MSKAEAWSASTFEKFRNDKLFARLAFCTAAAAVLTCCFCRVGLQVIVDGQSLGTVKNEAEFVSLMRKVENQAASYLGRPYSLNVDVDYNFGAFSSQSAINETNVKRLLFSKIDDIAVCYVLRVNDEIVAANNDKNVITSAMDEILSEYKPAVKGSNLSFVQKTEITQEPISIDYLMDISGIKSALKSTVAEESGYVIKKGDTLSALALRFGTSVDSIAAINPDVTPERLQIGQTLVTSKAVPLLSIQESATITYTENIPYQTVTEKNSAMYTNEKKVKTKGKVGINTITADVVYIDGEEVSRDITSTVRTSEPVTEVVYVGTKTPPAKAATGTYIRPYSGYVSSNYGYRHSEFHTGVDFAGPTGSAIVAADGGTVTFSGWNGNYGKCVIISHGNGIQTLYAHCSSLSVSVGDKVAKGQKIAKIGSTGRATGPHVHFEVRVNGKHVSPWKYIK